MRLTQRHEIHREGTNRTFPERESESATYSHVRTPQTAVLVLRQPQAAPPFPLPFRLAGRAACSGFLTRFQCE